MFAGIDTHKDMLAVGVVDAMGRVLTVTGMANTHRGFRQLERRPGHLG